MDDSATRPGPTAVPFVPSLSLAGALWFFRGPELVSWWLGGR